MTYDKIESIDFAARRQSPMKQTSANRTESEDHVVLEGNALYEIDEECVRRKMQEKKKRAGMEKRKRRRN